MPTLRDSVLFDDGSANDNSATATGIVPAGSNRYGLVKVGWFTNQVISTVVWGGVDITANLIKAAAHDGVSRKRLNWYYYLNPPASSADVVVTWAGSIVGKTMIVEAWDGVDQADPYGNLTFTADDQGGPNSDPHVMTVTAPAGKIITDCYYMWSNTASGPTLGGDQTAIETIIMNHGGGPSTACFGSSYSTSDGSVDHSWDSAAAATTNWCMYAIALNAAAAGDLGLHDAGWFPTEPQSNSEIISKW